MHEDVQEKFPVPDTEESVENPVIRPFLMWSENTIFKPQPESIGKKAFSVSGLIIGGASSYVTYPLGAGFGQIICNLANITNPEAQEAVRIFFGASAVIPMVALGAIATQDSFKKLVTPPNQENN